MINKPRRAMLHAQHLSKSTAEHRAREHREHSGQSL